MIKETVTRVSQIKYVDEVIVEDVGHQFAQLRIISTKIAGLNVSKVRKKIEKGGNVILDMSGELYYGKPSLLINYSMELSGILS